MHVSVFDLKQLESRFYSKTFEEFVVGKKLRIFLVKKS